MNKRTLIREKLVNFKKLLEENIQNEKNEHYLKVQGYDETALMKFASENISNYKLLGLDIVVDSFFSYLELDQNDADLKAKIQRYFEFLIEILEL